MHVASISTTERYTVVYPTKHALQAGEVSVSVSSLT